MENEQKKPKQRRYYMRLEKVFLFSVVILIVAAIVFSMYHAHMENQLAQQEAAWQEVVDTKQDQIAEMKSEYLQLKDRVAELEAEYGVILDMIGMDGDDREGLDD